MAREELLIVNLFLYC